MKPRIAQFCKLMAVGGRSNRECAILAGYKETDADNRANRLLKRPEVRDKIAKLQEKHNKKLDIDAMWIRKQLLEVVAKSGIGEEIMVRTKDGLVGSGEFKYDSAGVNKALDILNRMGGFYERDNEQKSQKIELKMDF